MGCTRILTQSFTLKVRLMTWWPLKVTEPVAPPPAHTTFMTRDPVRIVWVCYGFIQAVVIALMAAALVSPVLSSVVTGIALALYVAVSELFVRKETVPLEPLRDLAESSG